MNKKNSKNLLSEELKKFRLLSEYSFYTEKEEYDDTDNLILGDDKDVNEAEDSEEVPAEEDLDSVGDEAENLGFGDGADDTEDSTDLPDEPTDDMETPLDTPPVEAPIEAPIEEPASDEVELDVTELVNGAEEAKKTAELTNQKMDILLNKYNELSSKLSNMDKITNKIDNLEHQIEKRVPTPQEKLEMRSLDSYPYSLKLTDYWAEKDGAYNVMDNGEPKEKEYVLTKDVVDSTYNEANTKQSFNNPYEEEEI